GGGDAAGKLMRSAERLGLGLGLLRQPESFTLERLDAVQVRYRKQQFPISFTASLHISDNILFESWYNRLMKKRVLIFLAIAAPFVLFKYRASAHPASGIVVGAQGEVFFIHTGHGVCKIDTQGQLTCIHKVS